MVGQTDNYAKRLYVEEDSVADEGSKRRKSGHGSAPCALGAKDTVYRYLCPGRKAGRIIGRGGEIVRQLMASSGARIMIGDSIPGCDERLVTICSSSDGLAASGNTTDYACPAQDALFRVHEKLVGSETPGDEDFDADSPQVSVRLLVPSDQVGQIIGKGGQTIHSIRNDSEALVHIFKNEHIPLCANSSDELVQITGDVPAIRKALFQVSSILHKIPSHIQNLQDDTVYRYLCTERSIGSIIGKGGETVKKLRADTQAKITIGERVHGGKERVVTIFSCSEKTNIFGDMGDYVCPAQDALFRLHEKLVRNDPPADEDVDVEPHDSVRLLVPSDQIGHIIGKGGHAIRDIQSSNGVNIRILKGGNLPPCASRDDELLQITGQAPNVMKALVQVSSCLRDRPSRSQYLLFPDDSHSRVRHGDCSSFYSERNECSSKVFILRLLCPSANIARVIGKNGNTINQIRQQSGASIKVDSSRVEHDCIISISGKEFFEDLVSSTVDAAVRLQPRCSEMTERGYGEPLYITRLLVPTSQIGCLIGKGGSVVNEMRRATQANIRIMSEEDPPRVASENDVLVQISGELDAARNALIEISTRLKANVFGQESALSKNYDYDGFQGGGSPYRNRHPGNDIVERELSD